MTNLINKMTKFDLFKTFEFLKGQKHMITKTNDRSNASKYFNKFSKLLFIILLCFYVIPGIIYYLWYKKNKVTDMEYDNIINDDINSLSRRSLQKAGIEEDDIVAKPLIIKGFPLTGRGASTFKVKIGDDKQLRFTPIQITIINLLEHQLVSYQCVFDVLTGKALNEKTVEYFYKDIVSVSTETETAKLEDGSQINDAESFKLYTSGGTNITTTINSRSFVKTVGAINDSDYNIPTTEIDAAVQTIRKFVREKKLS